MSKSDSTQEKQVILQGQVGLLNSDEFAKSANFLAINCIVLMFQVLKQIFLNPAFREACRSCSLAFSKFLIFKQQEQLFLFSDPYNRVRGRRKKVGEYEGRNEQVWGVILLSMAHKTTF